MSLPDDFDADALPPEAKRQPRESAHDYDLFREYLAAGPGRSLHKLALARGLHERWVERLSSKHHWRARLRAFDRYVERAALADLARRAIAARRGELALSRGAAR